MISNNNPLLSGIIDVMNLHPDLIEQLQFFNLWDEVNQGFDIISPPDNLLEFVNLYLEKKGCYGISHMMGLRPLKISYFGIYIDYPTNTNEISYGPREKGPVTE
nr:828_t:CDS:2 [Entrophospora candida]